MRGFADCDYSHIGNAAKIIFNVTAPQNVTGAAYATGDGRGDVERFHCSQEDVPGELLSIHCGDHVESFQAFLIASGFSMLGGRCP
jgi:hypothetical protein